MYIYILNWLDYFLIKHFYDIVFSTVNIVIGGNEKSFSPFQVRGNDMVTE